MPVLQGLEDRCLLSTFQEYPIPDPDHGVFVAGLTAGPDGSIWFTNGNTLGGEAVGSVAPDGTVTEFLQRSDYVPVSIVTGADGNLWYGGFFFDIERVGIGRIATEGTSTISAIPDLGGLDESVGAVTLGPDGNVWYGQGGYTLPNGAVGDITPDGQATSSLLPLDPIGGHIGAVAMTAGPDGNLWFVPASQDGHSFVGKVTPDFQTTLFELPGTDNELARSITAGPDGNLWAPAVQFDHHTGQVLSATIDQITPDGQITEFLLPDGSHHADSITVGPDGNLWFTEPDANQIGMMTLDGQVTEYAIPTPNSNPQFITAGPDGNVWFAEQDSGQIGELVLNDTGSGVTVPSARSTALTQAVRSAAVDILFGAAACKPSGCRSSGQKGYVA